MGMTAQLRLTQRFAALNARGLQTNKACVAVAKELAGFVWAIGMQAQRENWRQPKEETSGIDLVMRHEQR